MSGHEGERRTRDCASTFQRCAAPGNQGCRAHTECVADHQRVDRGSNRLRIGSGIFESKVAARDTYWETRTSTIELWTLFCRASIEKKLSLKPSSCPPSWQQCERSKHTLSSCTQATIEIDPLFDDGDFTLSLSEVRVEELKMDYSQNSTSRAEKYFRDGCS